MRLARGSAAQRGGGSLAHSTVSRSSAAGHAIPGAIAISERFSKLQPWGQYMQINCCASYMQ